MPPWQLIRAAEPMTEPGHVERVDYQGRELFIVGTAHVSARSVEEVTRVTKG